MPEQISENQPLLITDKATYSRGTLNEMAIKLSLFLERQNVSVGDQVVILTSDKKTILACASACYESGFVLICLDPTLGTRQIAATLKALDPGAVLADVSILQKLNDAKIDLPAVVIDTSSKAAKRKWFTTKSSQWKTINTIFNSITVEERATASAGKTIDPNLAAYIMFTSGTTGNAKGVVITRAALQKHVATLSKVFNYNQDSRLLCFLPTYHTDGLVHCCYVPLLTGMCVIHPGAFQVSTDFEKNGLRHKPTHFLAVPTILSILHDLYSDNPGLFKSNGTRTVISTAGVLKETLTEDFKQTFGINLRNFYGLTETISGALYCDTAIHPHGSLGIPIDVEARLISDNTIVTDCHVEGELQLRSDQLMHSYYKNPKATATAFDNGWFKTGDLFTLDDNGHYHFKSRLKDVIKKGGVTGYPEDIRHHIVDYPGVIDCEVVGLDDTVFEQLIAACIVAEDNINLADLSIYCKEVLANEMQPDHWVIFSQLPRTAVGKADRSKLRSIAKKQLAAEDTNNSCADALQQGVLDLAASVFKTDLESLRTGMGKNQISGWDSYAHLKFIKQIEKKYSIRLKARDIMKIETLEDAAALIRAKTSPSEAA